MQTVIVAAVLKTYKNISIRRIANGNEDDIRTAARTTNKSSQPGSRTTLNRTHSRKATAIQVTTCRFSQYTAISYYKVKRTKNVMVDP